MAEEAVSELVRLAREKGYTGTERIEAAFEFAKKECLRDREWGIDHNLAVGRILAELGLDPITISAGLVHNALSSKECTPERLKGALGAEVAGIVEHRQKFAMGVSSGQTGIEKTRKLVMSLTTDIRLVLLELAERYDLLGRMNDLPESERKIMIEEVNQIFLPVARKLGIYQLTSKMEDLVFKNINPSEYENLESRINQRIAKLWDFVEKTKTELKEKLKENGVEATVKSRNKGVYSTHEKMLRKKKDFSEIQDICGIRVVTATIENCYRALGIANSLGRYLPEEFDDYIAKPKDSGYRSIHTVIANDNGDSVEIQIRTHEMNDLAEYGVAAHWRYKSAVEFDGYDSRFSWLREVFEWQRDGSGKKDSGIRSGGNVFVFTPKGDLVELSQGATILDFAYHIHSELGNKCSKARANGKIVPLDYVLENADVIEIISSPTQKPKSQWLSIVKTSKARQKISSILGITEASHAPSKEVKAKPAFRIDSANKRFRLAKCCSPLPGDEIIAFPTTKRKISVHAKDCVEAKKIFAGKKQVTVDWSEGGKGRDSYLAELTVISENRSGLLKDALNAFSSLKIDALSVNAKAKNKTIACTFEIKVKDLSHLNKAIDALYNVSGVTNVGRGTLSANA